MCAWVLSDMSGPAGLAHGKAMPCSSQALGLPDPFVLVPGAGQQLGWVLSLHQAGGRLSLDEPQAIGGVCVRNSHVLWRTRVRGGT